MWNVRHDLEKSVATSLFGDWCDNPFEIEDWKKLIESLDVELFKDKRIQLLVRAIKKMNSLPENKDVLPTIDMVVGYVELNAPKVLPIIQEAIVEAMEKQPLSVDLCNHSIKLLEQYKLKDELKDI